MGYYIQQLVDLYDARIEVGPYFDATGKRVSICVVENGLFIAFSEDEMKAFCGRDTGRQRPRTWLSLPRETVIQLCPFVKEVLPKI